MNLGGVIRLNKTGLCVLLGACLVLFIYVITSDRSNKNTTQSQLKINLKDLLAVAIKAAENGGKEVDRTKNNMNVKSKGLTKEGLRDSVTNADFFSHCAIMKTLKHAYPTLNVISEEAKTECEPTQIVDFKIDRFPKAVHDEWVNTKDVTVWIDPLDATYEYTEHLYDYVTTMVCVAVKGKPIIGVIHKPFSKNEYHTFWAWSNISRSANLIYKKSKREKKKIVISRSHSGTLKNLLENNVNNCEIISAAGAGYKVLEVALGDVDAYLHNTVIKKWDICAGNAILTSMGGRMTTKFNKEIDYADSEHPKNEDGLVATMTDHDFFIKKLEP